MNDRNMEAQLTKLEEETATLWKRYKALLAYMNIVEEEVKRLKSRCKGLSLLLAATAFLLALWIGTF